MGSSFRDGSVVGLGGSGFGEGGLIFSYLGEGFGKIDFFSGFFDSSGSDSSPSRICCFLIFSCTIRSISFWKGLIGSSFDSSFEVELVATESYDESAFLILALNTLGASSSSDDDPSLFPDSIIKCLSSFS